MRMLTVSKNEAGQRLDKLLAKYLNLAGKSFIYKMMRKKNITLNGKKCDGSEHLAEGDEIKLFLAEDVRSHQIEGPDRFIRFGVNVRFFNIEGTGDMLIDTVGMSTLFLPDLQYHFHGMDPNWVVNHAYNVASYILEHDNPIQDGETIDGVADGQMCREIQWKCQYEDALIQPPRGVLDINMGKYASGGR